MELCYDGVLVMPSSYAVMDEEEMMYVEGCWDLKYSHMKKVLGIPVGIYFTLRVTVATIAIIGFASTVVATNDKACKTKFSTNIYLGF